MKALFFDVDGTLLDEKTHQIPTSAKEAIRMAQANGHKVFINSGRTYGMLRQVASMISADGWLCGCGTELIYQGKTIYEHHIDETTKTLIKAAAERYHVIVFLEGPSGWHCSPNPSLYEGDAALESRFLRMKSYVEREESVAPESYDSDYVISKFCIQTGIHSDFDGFSQAFGTDFIIIDRGKGFYECVPAEHGKDAAVAKMLHHLGLQRADAYAFGDSTNDIAMFTACDHCTAMKKHAKELEAFHPYITDSVEEDGILHALQHFQLI